MLIPSYLSPLDVKLKHEFPHNGLLGPSPNPRLQERFPAILPLRQRPPIRHLHLKKRSSQSSASRSRSAPLTRSLKSMNSTSSMPVSLYYAITRPLGKMECGSPSHMITNSSNAKPNKPTTTRLGKYGRTRNQFTVLNCPKTGNLDPTSGSLSSISTPFCPRASGLPILQ